MRICCTPEMGLGANEISAMRRLSRPSLQIIAEELHEPESRETVRWILSQRNPERALAEAIAENVRQATASIHEGAALGYGMGDYGMGKSFFKKLAKIHRKVFNTVKKVASKVANKDPIYRAIKPTLKKVANTVRKNLPIILTVAGAALAPFTGGASLAAAAVLTTARQLYANKIDAHKAVVAGKHEAAAMQAQVDQQTAEVTKQADDVYHQNQEIFLAAGYTEAKWNALTLDQKIDLIQRASDGKLQPTDDAVRTQQQVEQNAAQAISQVVPKITSTGGSYSTGGGGGYSYGSPDGQESVPEAPQEAGPAPSTKTESSGSSVVPWLAAAGAVAYVAFKKH